MDGKRTVVEEIGGTMNQLQMVQETETRLLVLQIDADHRSGSLAKLLLCQLMEWIILQAHIVHTLDLRERLKLPCQLQRIAALHAITRIERLQSDGLHISHLRSHVGTKVEKHLTIKSLGKIAMIWCTVIDDHTAKRCGTATDILGTGYHLDIHAQILSRELGERNDGSISHQGHILLVSHLRKRLQVGHLQLRIGNDFQEHATGILINCLAYLFYIGQIAQSDLHSETAQGGNQQGIGITEEMLGTDDVLALCSKRHQRIADSSHTRIESCNMLRTGQRLDAALQVGYRRVLHTRIVRSLDLVSKGIRHDGCVVKFVSQRIIYRNAQRIISVSAFVCHMNGLSLFLHFLLISLLILYLLYFGCKSTKKMRYRNTKD